MTKRLLVCTVGTGVLLLLASVGTAWRDISNSNAARHSGVAPHQSHAAIDISHPPASVKPIATGSQPGGVRVSGAGLQLFNGDYKPVGKLNGSVVYRRDSGHVLARNAKRQNWVLATDLRHIANGDTGKWYYRASGAKSHTIPASGWETVAAIG